MYQAGLHLISEFKVADPELLKDSVYIKHHLDELIKENDLTKVGEVYHQFENSGYTAVICLTESHISIHTWPEYNRVTFDVFLSNYLKYNNNTAHTIHNRVIALLGAIDVNLNQLIR